MGEFYYNNKITDNISLKVGRGTVYIYTDTGLSFINKISKKYNNILKTIGNIGIVSVLVTSIIGILFLAFGFYQSFNMTPNAGNEPTNSLLIPGVNDFIPIEATLVVIVVVFISMYIHEFAHGLLGFREGYTVNEWGIILLLGIIPIGAYVDIPMEEIEEGKLWSSLRILSAGILANYIACIIMIVIVMLLNISLTNGFLYYFGILPQIPTVESITFIESFSFWMVFINFNLAFVNSLPIYALDGGSIAEISYDKYISTISTKTFVYISSSITLIFLLSLYTIPYL